jgi:hypothetical protein
MCPKKKSFEMVNKRRHCGFSFYLDMYGEDISFMCDGEQVCANALFEFMPRQGEAKCVFSGEGFVCQNTASKIKAIQAAKRKISELENKILEEDQCE